MAASYHLDPQPLAGRDLPLLQLAAGAMNVLLLAPVPARAPRSRARRARSAMTKAKSATQNSSCRRKFIAFASSLMARRLVQFPASAEFM